MLVILAWFAVKKENEFSSISHESGEEYCKKDILPENTVIVIDHTDSINAIQRASLEKRLTDIAENIEKNGQIQFYSVEPIESETTVPSLKVCNPGSEKDTNDWDGNRRLAKKRYEKIFANAVKEKLDSLLKEDEANTSPIMRSVQSAIVNSFIGNKNKSQKMRLILVSDLLEHTKDFSLYSSNPDFNSFRNSEIWPSVRSNMDNIEVTILWLYRRDATTHQKPNLKLFWQQYFIEQGASLVKFVPVEG